MASSAAAAAPQGLPAAAADVLAFWFGRPGDEGYGKSRVAWFKKDDAFDQSIRTQFGTLIEQALAGELDGWAASVEQAAAAAAAAAASAAGGAEMAAAAKKKAEDCGRSVELQQPEAEALSALALVIVLDQFTRNTFRNTPKAFAGDARALRVATALVQSGAHKKLAAVQRSFVYLPFEHAEDLGHQHTAVRLFKELEQDTGNGQLAVWAQKHLDVVARFGRFPHRNAILGRASTPEEAEFLLQPGSSF
eukprot:m.167379 g.167379  ORF g.167379 m.167379 type:complete len:249 (+) comp17194_c1_seq2:464-1210(+)